MNQTNEIDLYELQKAAVKSALAGLINTIEQPNSPIKSYDNRKGTTWIHKQHLYQELNRILEHLDDQ